MEKKDQAADHFLDKDGPQLINLSHHLFDSTIDRVDFTAVSEIGSSQSRNEMNIWSTVDAIINTTDRPNGFPRSNHRNVIT